jgi:hypothetical protein
VKRSLKPLAAQGVRDEVNAFADGIGDLAVLDAKHVEGDE